MKTYPEPYKAALFMSVLHVSFMEVYTEIKVLTDDNRGNLYTLCVNTFIFYLLGPSLTRFIFKYFAQKEEIC